MQNDFTDNTADLLIRYMDGEMGATEQAATEQLLRDDVALQERYQYFLAAKRAIRAQGLKQRMQAIHREYVQKIQPERSTTKVIKSNSFLKKLVSIAAIFIVAVLGYGVFQYAAADNQSLYNDNFVAYQLPVNRSNETTGNIDALYNAGNYAAVINAFNQEQQKAQKDYFLAAQSYLQLNNANAAVSAFLQVEKLNSNSTEKYFEQETDYYLLLAYIKADKIDLAEKQLDKITSNKQHLFYNKANEISRTRLMLLKWKE